MAWHKPPYEGHPDRGPDPLTLLGVVPLMERHGVQLVLLGHNHFYERTKPILGNEASTVEAGGVTYVITGAGGGGLYPVEPWDLQQVGVSAHNFLVGRVDRCALSIDAIDDRGGFLDRFSLDRC